MWLSRLPPFSRSPQMAPRGEFGFQTPAIPSQPMANDLSYLLKKLK